MNKSKKANSSFSLKDTELPSEIFNFSKTGSLTAKIINEGKPLILFSKDLDEIKKENLRLKNPPIGSACKVWLGAPLIVRKKIIGAVAVQSYSSEKKYNESDLDIAPIGPALIENRVFRRVGDKFVSLLKKYSPNSWVPTHSLL